MERRRIRAEKSDFFISSCDGMYRYNCLWCYENQGTTTRGTGGFCGSQ